MEGEKRLQEEVHASRCGKKRWRMSPSPPLQLVGELFVGAYDPPATHHPRIETLAPLSPELRLEWSSSSGQPS
ncbi:hypothetical protein LIER_21020 [Lithospermum erythrorhizon]|uniref:Uncharacterized protein n=1 Tax=Lithospermum erythrorhizon TaxID=34254 RepID=A0AAV3QUD9_LITER